jgi:hypothetical protein
MAVVVVVVVVAVAEIDGFVGKVAGAEGAGNKAG